MKWDHWLEEMKSLPPDSPEWEEVQVEKFLQAVMSLAEEKRHEREAGRERLRQALSTLRERCAEAITFFEMTDCEDWSAEACLAAETAAVAEQVEHLNSAFVRYTTLRQQPVATLAEELERRRTLAELEEKIRQYHEQLSGSLAPQVPSPIPPESSPLDQAQPAGEESILGLEEIPTEPEISGEEVPETTPSVSDETQAESEISAGETIEPVLTASVEVEPDAILSAEPLLKAFQVETERLDEELARPLQPTETELPLKPEKEPVPTLIPPSTLPPVREIATILQSDDRDENWQAFLWALVAEGDLPGAYWLARSRAVAERGCPVEDWLLKAVQGAQWLSVQPLFTNDLLEITRQHQPDRHGAQGLLGLAAALCPALTAPESGLSAWLSAPDCCPPLHSVVTAVGEFARSGRALRPEDLLGAEGDAQREESICEASQEVKRWLDEAPMRRMKIKRATDVWYNLVRPQGNLRALLLPVSEDRRGEVKQVHESLCYWQDRDEIVKLIHKIDRKLAGRARREIVSDPLDQIIRYVKEACSKAERWCELVEREQEIKTSGNWIFEQVRKLRDSVQAALPEVETVLSELRSPAYPLSLAAAARCLQRSVVQLWQTLNLLPSEAGMELSTMWGRDEWLRDASDLEAALGYRLLGLPEVALPDAGLPSQETLPSLAPMLRDACAEGRSLRAAFEGWLAREDYRFADTLLRALEDEPDIDQLRSDYEERLTGSRAALREVISQTEAAIDQAVLDGLIAEANHAEYSAKVEAIKTAIETVDPDEGLKNFAPKRAQLQEVQEALESARRERLVQQHDLWHDIQRRLTTFNLAADNFQQVVFFVQAALERGDTRVADECLARLTEVLEGSAELDESWFAQPDERHVLEEFLEATRCIEEWLGDIKSLHHVAADIQQGRTCGGIQFGGLPQPRRDEAAEAIEHWRQMKVRGARQSNNNHRIAILLRYLGFELASGVGTPVQVEDTGADWLYARASMSASEPLARPVPQFGSQAQGRYDVVCLWDRPGMTTLGARLHDLRLDVRSVLVLYLGRLTARQRYDVTRLTREQDLAMAVLDETLLIFLAGERDARLPVFLRCALPFAALNPYTPFQAGDVPPEMFFGRQDMARELQRPSGSCLVYGGRQLGKSALLRHVQREFHRPEQEQYAWVEDIKLVGDPQSGQTTETIWRRLREGFKRHGLISERVRTDNPEEIDRYIRETMLRFPQRRVLVMFDEADNFLSADAEDNFSTVTKLRTLMWDTERRFKVVFAGLHNVQRFQGIPNQPLAHFGTPLLVGPLEPKAAQQLVCEPMETLGYRFKDDTTVLRILSYTNYHPGLIQLFCSELLNRLRAHPPAYLPPHTIEQAHVEAVYRTTQVRERIRERFDWTIALDPRYQAIAWTLVEDQMEARDSYAQAYSSGEILQLARQSWLQGFSEVSPDQLRGLLDEMCGLGVLVRNAEGRYRLRSPNLVRLMGTEEEIFDRLVKLSEKQPEVKFDADSHHVPLDDAAQRYSPLTYAQERSLNQPRFGVGLIFASEALGFLYIPATLKRFIPSDLPEDILADWADIPPEIVSGVQIREWLRRYLGNHAKYHRLIVCQRITGGHEAAEERVQVAWEFCRQHHQSAKQWLRVLFVFDAPATWMWLSLPRARREALEERVDAATFPHCWNEQGVRQRLSQRNKMDSEQICQRVLVATGGWPYLLDVLLDRCETDDPRPFVDEIEDELALPDSPLRGEFQRCLGLKWSEPAYRMLQFIHREKEVPLELVTPDLIGGEPPLSPEECTAAVEYLQRMGCVELHGEMLQVEAIVKQVLTKP